ncbi:BTAD domain-containing putative transcriptional regulator [Streptomyces sp. JHA26]|uniref:AfsR/SARP family transcriptional regulator n=1 Tax=Streptomyces sp. JHA26 TaxID=1917143 RepID=UPI00098B6E2F|nr:BTAD domain-containing putative transcriptional regulator [Streptomyces sp. JHA26]
MLFRMLGVPELYDETRHRSVRLSSSKQGTLLGALLARPGRPVPVDRLVYEVWGDHPPGKAGNALQAHVSRLRQALSMAQPEQGNRSRLQTHRSGYVLRAHERETDCGWFRLAVARARHAAERDPHSAYRQLRQALGLWRGEVLEGSVRGPICGAMAQDLERVRLDALEAMFGAALRTGRHAQVHAELREAVRAYPRHTRFRAQLALTPYEDVPAAGPVPVPGHGPARRSTAPSAEHLPRPAGPDRYARPPAQAGQADELDRLRGLVQLLASEQQSLRVRLERLSALVGHEGPAAS